MDVVASVLAKGELIPPPSPLTYAILNGVLVLGGILVLTTAFRIARQRRR